MREIDRGLLRSGMAVVLSGWLLAFASAPAFGTPPGLTVQFSAATYSANLSAGQVTVTVTLAGTPAGDVSASYRVIKATPGTAVPGVDYVAASAQDTVTFVKANGDTTKTFNVTFIKNTLPGPNLTINLELYGVTGGAIVGTPGTTTITIVNDNAGPAPVLNSIAAQVTSTPPRTPRNADGSDAAPGGAAANDWPAPVNLTFTSTTAITQTKSGGLNFPATMFDQPNALVLYVAQDAASVQLTVTANNLGTRQVAFDIIRAPDDAAGVGAQNVVPSKTITAATKATLGTEVRGSFQVLAFLDKNGNGTWDTSEQGVTLPYILVSATSTAIGDRSQAGNALNIVRGFFAAAKVPSLITFCGTFGQPGTTNAGNAAIGLDADVTLVGGGSNGQRGLDRTFWGWCNNITVHDVQGNYPAAGAGGTARTGQLIFASNGAAAKNTYLGRGECRAGALPVPVPADGETLPLLDAGVFWGGGINVALTTSTKDGGQASLAAFWDNNPPKGTLGGVATVMANDAPSLPMRSFSPLAGAKLINSETLHLSFIARMAGWTNSLGAAGDTTGAPNAVGFRTFCHARFNIWTVQVNWVTVPGPPFADVKDPKRTITLNKNNWSPAMNSTGFMEVHPPVPGTQLVTTQQ